MQRIQAAKRFFASFFYMLIVFLFMAMPGLAASENNSGGALTTGIGKTVRGMWFRISLQIRMEDAPVIRMIICASLQPIPDGPMSMCMEIGLSCCRS